MWNTRSQHMWTTVFVCTVCMLGSLINQGCSKEEPVKDSPYAALDKAFPKGRPGLADIAERDADKEYQTKIRASVPITAQLHEAVIQTTKATESYLQHLKDNLAKHPELPQHAQVLKDRLASDEHYQALLQAQQKAEQAEREHLEATRAVIRARMNAPMATYDAMKAEADKAAQEAGVAVRTAKAMTHETQQGTPKVDLSRPVYAPKGTAPDMDATTQKALKEQFEKKLQQNSSADHAAGKTTL